MVDFLEFFGLDVQRRFCTSTLKRYQRGLYSRKSLFSYILLAEPQSDWLRGRYANNLRRGRECAEAYAIYNDDVFAGWQQATRQPA